LEHFAQGGYFALFRNHPFGFGVIGTLSLSTSPTLCISAAIYLIF
jgi:hypothetical protein